jgi:hypothetical protein
MLDVLEYNSLAEQFNSLQTSLNVATTYANNVTYPAAYANASGNAAATQLTISLNCSTVKQNNYGYLATCALQSCPWDCNTWASVPKLTGNTGGLRIYDSASGYIRCGVSCLWTVPAGASFARFEDYINTMQLGEEKLTKSLTISPTCTKLRLKITIL